MLRGFFATLLLAFGLWSSFQAPFLIKGTAGACQSACRCYMHDGMCPMKAANARSKHGPASAAGASQLPTGVSCSCSVSSPVSIMMVVSHADLLFIQPPSNLPCELPIARQHAGREFAFLPAPAERLPDPPPKLSPANFKTQFPYR